MYSLLEISANLHASRRTRGFPVALPNQFRCQTSKAFKLEGPALRRLKPARSAFKQPISLFPNRRHLWMAAIRKQLLIFWWS
jgi:hypothetical protein